MSRSPTLFDRLARREQAMRDQRGRWLRTVGPDADLPRSFARRDFLALGAATGAALGVPALLVGCESSPSQSDSAPLFFNLAHERRAGAQYFLVGGGRVHPMVRVADAPHVLARARASNRFLRGVPDDQITHQVEGIPVSFTDVRMWYAGSMIDRVQGTWSMSSIYLHVPDHAADNAFVHARRRTPSGPLPMSIKRERYGHPPATTAADLREENALFDTTSHATTLIMLHPDLLSADPDGAHNIITNHVGQGSASRRLADTLMNLGAAMPEPDASGWATLVPVAGPDGPFKTRDGRIQYFPDWQPAVDSDAAKAIAFHVDNVKDDASLGATLSRGTALSASDKRGKVWARRQGFTTVDPASPSLPAVQGDGLRMTMVDQSPENGLDITAAFVETGPGVQVTFTLSNSYLRYLGAHVQFLDLQDPPQPLLLNSIKGYPESVIPGHNRIDDTDYNMFVGMVPPEYTLFAIPISDGSATVTLTMPSTASGVRVLAGGLSLSSGHSAAYPETIAGGIAMTVLVNYGLTLFFMAAGASETFSPFQKRYIVPAASLLATEMRTLFATILKDSSALANPATWKALGAAMLKAFISYTETQTLGQIVQAMAAILTASAVEQSIPIVGQIMRAVSCLVGAGDLIHTSVDLAESPWTYVKDAVFTHALNVTLTPAQAQNFPPLATHYRVTVSIDNGTPFRISAPIGGAVGSSLLVPFSNLPLGGMAKVTAALTQPSTTPGNPDVLWAQGGTRLFVNDKAHSDVTIPMTANKVEIDAATTYVHVEKTTLANGPDGQPVPSWMRTSVAPTTVSVSNNSAPGDLSALGNITVRQGTITPAPAKNGYLGYSWRSFSSGIVGCGSGGAQGQLDQVANLATDASLTARTYATGSCGLPSGVKLAYSLLSDGSTNFYLDTSTGLIRQVQLEPVPQFDSPSSDRAWGKLNFPSDALLLHPAGKLISLSFANHRMETLTLPSAARSDAKAATELLALANLGPGRQSGRLLSPIAAAISIDGTVLVLEQGNSRVQAFDANANPVPYFRNQPVPYVLPLRSGASLQYLDIAVEYTRLIYVLSVDRSSGASFRMDIYDPTQSGSTPVTGKSGVNAGRLTVDLWRNVYTLNFEVMQLNGGYPSVTQPSVSLWAPCIAGQSC